MARGSEAQQHVKSIRGIGRACVSHVHRFAVLVPPRTIDERLGVAWWVCAGIW